MQAKPDRITHRRDQFHQIAVGGAAHGDLGPIGLAGYLTEGCGIDPASLAADRDRLDTLTGWVLVLPSQAIPDRPATLSPQDGVTLIGTYAEPRTNWQATPQPTPDFPEDPAAPDA